MKQSPSKTARHFWYDTILYDAASLSFLASAVGGDHIVIGSDYPFTIMQKQPGKFASRVLDEATLAKNAFGFLGRSHEVRKLAGPAEGDSGSKQGSRHG